MKVGVSMMVYSWKTLLVTIFCGGAIITNAIYRIIQGEYIYIGWIVIGGYLFSGGLRASLTEQGYIKDQENAKEAKRIYGKYFGKFAPLVPYGALILFIIAYILIRLFSEHLWIGMIVILLAPVYQWIIYLYLIMKDERNNKE